MISQPLANGFCFGGGPRWFEGLLWFSDMLGEAVFRIPDGEWIGIRAETSYRPDGIGTTIGTLFDEQGAVGAIQQSVLVRRRPGRS